MQEPALCNRPVAIVIASANVYFFFRGEGLPENRGLTVKSGAAAVIGVTAAKTLGVVDALPNEGRGGSGIRRQQAFQTGEGAIEDGGV